MYSIAEKMRLSVPTATIWMKIDPYCHRQKCSPMTLLSGDIHARFMRIYAGVSCRGGDFKWQWACRYKQFSPFSLAISSETLEIRPALLLYTQSAVGFSVMPKCVTLSDLECLFRAKFCFRAGFSGFRRATFEHNCTVAQIFDRDSSLCGYSRGFCRKEASKTVWSRVNARVEHLFVDFWKNYVKLNTGRPTL